jgi:hypothetical protein
MPAWLHLCGINTQTAWDAVLVLLLLCLPTPYRVLQWLQVHMNCLWFVSVCCLQVKDWANGQAGDIGELAMVPGTLSTGFTAGTSSPGAAASAAAAAAAAEDSGPFWQQLAQHAQYLEVRDVLDMVVSLGGKCLVLGHS